MRTLPILPTLALAALAFASGCGDTVSNAPVDATKSTLHRSRDCNELLGDLRADTVAKINGQIDGMIAAIRDCRAALGDQADACNSYYYGGAVPERGAVFDDTGSGTDAPSASDGSGSPLGGSESGSGNGAGTPAFSDTNTQVDGVDEADLVKTDGQRLYVLHGSTFRIEQAYPLDTLSELGVTEIEGTPSEMYVENGIAVIFSQVDGAPIYAASGTTPPNQSGGDLGVPVAPGGYEGYGGYYAQPLTKITVLRIAADQTTTVAKETYFEGSYLSSRRVGSHVRTVLQGSSSSDLSYELMSAVSPNGLDPNADPIAALESVRTAAIAKAGELGLDRWLPRTFDKQGSATTATSLACANAYTPTVGSTEGGLTELSTLNLDDLAAQTQQIAIFGQAGTVYGTEGTLYIAATGWTNTPWGGGIVTTAVSSPPSTGTGTEETSPAPIPDSADGGSANPQSGSVGLLDQGSTTVARPEVPDVVSLDRTHIHEFSFGADGSPIYVGSGTVDGQAKDQFSLDERNGSLRIATTERRMYRSELESGQTDSRPHSLTHVTTLHVQDGALVQQGAVRDLAPDESIQSVRFVGARGYVVTFRQVDPLFAIDLNDPAAPSVLGELTIPGFSQYMHPIDDGHLLTIGQDADASGRVTGLALQIFDVTNGAAPKLLQKFAYSGQAYGYSEASYNHKAFTYFADQNLLAFPYTSYDSATYQQTSTLELFRVSLDTGFTRLGAIDHSALFTSQQNGCYYMDPTVRRGLFIGSTAYSVSLGGIVAKPIDDLSGAGATLALPNPYASYAGCGVGSEGDSIDGGSAPAPTPAN